MARLKAELAVDCRGLFVSVFAQWPGRILGRAMLNWISALQGVYWVVWLGEIAWVPTESTIRDAQTQWGNGLELVWMEFYRAAVWAPYYISELEEGCLLVGGTIVTER